MPFNPQKNQPCHVRFDLQVGPITKIWESPNKIPISFSATINGAGVVNGTFEMSLFDDTGFDIEPYLFLRDTKKPNIIKPTQMRARWGYTAQGQPYMTQWIELFPDSIAVTVQENSFMLNLSGKLGTVFKNMITNSGPLSGSINEIIKQIEQRYNAKVIIQPEYDKSATMTYANDSSTTEPSEAKFNKQPQTNDLNFLLELASHLVDKDGRSGYTVNIRPIDPQSGKRIILISNNNSKGVLSSQDQEIAKSYKIKNLDSYFTYEVRGIDSPVISWSPDINLAPAIMGGVDLAAYHSYQHVTGDPDKVIMDRDSIHERTPDTSKKEKGSGVQLASPPNDSSNPDTNAPKSGHNFNPETLDKNTTGVLGRMRPVATMEPNRDFWRHVSSQVMKNLGMVTGSLSILGDPAVGMLNSSNVVRVIFYYPTYASQDGWSGGKKAGVLHYTSGEYLLDSSTHSISGGNYTTTLSLKSSELWAKNTKGSQ